VSTPFEDGLARLLRIGQHLGVNVDHHLVALARGAGTEPVMKGRFREQGQRIRLLLGDRGRFRGDVPETCRGLGALPGPLIEALAGRGQGLHEQRSHLRLEPPAEDHHAVLVVIHVQGSARVPPLRLPSLGTPVHAPPPAHDPLDVGRRARAPHRQEPSFGLRRGHAGQATDLGVGQLPAAQGLGGKWQCTQSAGHSDPLPGRAQVEPHAPGEPGGAGTETRVPSPAGVELTNQIEQARGGRVEVGGQLGDLVTEPVQLCDGMPRSKDR